MSDAPDASEALQIIVADDHPLFRDAIVLALQASLATCRTLEASSFSTLEALVREQESLDLVLLDLSMPGANGFSSLVFLRGERPEVPVIVISSNDHPRTIRRAQQFGAAGFVPKSSPVAVIREAVRAVMDGGAWFPAQKAERSEEDAQLAARLAQLTPQQFRVLMCMAEGLLNKQIAGELGLAENTVKVHVAAILRKLECHSRTQAAVLVKALHAEGGDDGEVQSD